MFTFVGQIMKTARPTKVREQEMEEEIVNNRERDLADEALKASVSFTDYLNFNDFFFSSFLLLVAFGNFLIAATRKKRDLPEGAIEILQL